MYSKWIVILHMTVQIFTIPEELLASEFNVTEEYFSTAKDKGNETLSTETEYFTKSNDELKITYANETTGINSAVNSSDSNNTTQVKVVSCKPNKGGEPVEIVNNTRLLLLLTPDSNITSKETPADCIVIFFYMKWCPFSSAAARHFNALPRVFPDIKMVALDVMSYQMFNAQYGIVGVPTLMLMHNSKPVAKFNESEYRIDLFAEFLSKHTGIESSEKMYITSNDFKGPLSATPEYQTDYCLGLSWLFITICGVYFFTKSKWWTWIIETIQNTWRESEAQHEHAD